MRNENNSRFIPFSRSNCILLGLIFLFTIVIFALSIATLGVIVHRLDSRIQTATVPSFRTTSVSPLNSLVDQINIHELMKHLKELQAIADASNGTRVITTSGFNGTLEYITSQLEQNTNFNITHQYFTVKNFIMNGTPRFQTEINGNQTNHTYETDFSQILFSPSATFNSFLPIVAIPKYGCTEADWSNLPVRDQVALVSRGNCTYLEKTSLAEKFNVTGVLIYNDGSSCDNMGVITGIRNNLGATVPAFFLSYNLGKQLLDGGNKSYVKMTVNMSDAEGVGNICADTRSGDAEKTIVVGSHSDSVRAGSGINDNGSGTVGNLVLALNLARLYQTSSLNYATYPYRVRFCWWGAEEHGLIGSRYHVAQAGLSNTTTVGERLQDYLVNFNYDMLAGPNFRFGIHDSAQVPLETPSQALNGTSRITNLFRQWFNEQKLPWSNASLGGGSDYVPFLAAGIAVGGINTGAGTSKSDVERDQYSAVLGTGNAGVANAPYDPCYHQKCDRIANINPFAYEKVVKAAAYALEYLGRLNDLEKWLYPQGRNNNIRSIYRNQIYDDPYDPELI